MIAYLGKNNRYFLFFKKDLIIILSIWLFSFILDFIWISFHKSPPEWDQGFHLSGLFSMAGILKSFDVLNNAWWTDIWSVSNSYRGPFTYIISSIFINIFGWNYNNAILSNSIFNFILLFSVFSLGKAYKNSQTGIWAALICACSPALIHQRTDYLIDFSLTAVITMSWYFISIWYL